MNSLHLDKKAPTQKGSTSFPEAFLFQYLGSLGMDTKGIHVLLKSHIKYVLASTQNKTISDFKRPNKLYGTKVIVSGVQAQLFNVLLCIC